MTVKVVPLPGPLDQLIFDVILPGGHAKTFTLYDYDLRAYRGARIPEIIEQKVLDFLQELGHTGDTSIQFY